MRSVRFLAAFLPGFPLQVAVRAAPSLENGRVPFAVADTVLDESRREIHSGATLLAASARAHRAGVRAGMTVAQGRAVCHGLVVRALSPEGHEVARIALAEVLSGFGPRVEVLGTGSTRQSWEAGLADVSGVHDEHALAHEAGEALARAGLVARVAVASTRFAARAVAAHARPPHPERSAPAPSRRASCLAQPFDSLRSLRVRGVVPSGGERDALRDLPIDALSLPERALDVFAALSVRTLGELARLPADALARRFGGHATAWAELARGIDPSPMTPFKIPAALFERVDLGDPVEQLEALVFPLSTLFDRVCARLVGRGRAAAKVALHLVLEEWDKPAPAAILEIRLPRPTVVPRTMLDVARERLGNLTLPGRVREMAVEVLDSVPTRRTQLELFSKAPPAPERLAVTLGRLASAFGEGSVFAAELADEHRPERAWKACPLDPGASTAHESAAPYGVDAARPSRLLAKPEPVHMGRTDRERAPDLVVRGRRLAIVAMDGPERLDGDWWNKQDAFARDYYVVATEEGSRWWIFLDRATGGWLLHGTFD